MNEAIAAVQEVTAPISARIGRGIEAKRLKVAGLSPRHVALLIYRWILRNISGWSDGLLYRDAGERGIRAFAGFGNIVFFLMFLALAVIVGPPGPVFYLFFLWAFAFHLSDRLAARNRRQREKTEGYLYSYFLGWPRWLPSAKEASRWQQGAILLVVGLVVFLFDRTGGILLAITGGAVCVLQRIHKLIRREEVMDILDAEWQAHDREEAQAEVVGNEQEELTDEDYIRTYSA